MPFRPTPKDREEKTDFLKMFDLRMRGKGLEDYAAKFEIARRRRFWFFRESDKRLRRRILDRIAQGPFHDD